MPPANQPQPMFVRVLEAVSVVVLTSFLGWQAFTTYTMSTNIVRATVQLENHLIESSLWKDRIIRLENFKSEGGRFTAEMGEREAKERREGDAKLAESINSNKFALQRITDQQKHIDKKLDEIAEALKEHNRASAEHRKKIDSRFNIDQ